ncbi:MAG: phosphoribosylformylglycinamidine cyclo-ligase [Spirochaetes bacterium]|nr:phosphoribosylformylglycinamidine cyclo-ligase [Spirochaetota bacterium]
MSLSYKKAGVDIEYADELIERIKKNVKSTYTKQVLTPIGGFASLVGFDRKYKDPVMVSGTDGVGTKLLLASMIGKHDTVGIDLVAMCVNDVVTTGGRPLFFLDYIAMGSLSSIPYETVIKGIVDGCKLAGCALVGGETAELPDMYKKGEYDLAGFAVGVAEKKEILPRKDIVQGDVLIGIPSSGFHSNGYSLIRKVIETAKLDLKKNYGFKRSLGAMLIEPTTIYVKALLALTGRKLIKAAAHITGGGLLGNATRVIPDNVGLAFMKSEVSPKGIFRFIQEQGCISDMGMTETFNNGIGMVLIASKKNVAAITRTLKTFRLAPRIIGSVVRGKGDGFIE